MALIKIFYTLKFGSFTKSPLIPSSDYAKKERKEKKKKVLKKTIKHKELAAIKYLHKSLASVP